MEVDRDSEHGNDNDNGGYDEEDFDNTFTRPVQNTFDMRVGDSNDNDPEEMLEQRAGSTTTPVIYTADTPINSDNINFEVISAIAGTNNLGGVRNFTFRVRCPGPQDTIQRLPRLMPFITALYLDNSSFYNFRIFGEEISSLKVVSACNCGIADFSGVDFLVNLKELYVANNAVENVFELSDLLNIEIVDLEGNIIDDFDSVSFLYLTPKLHTITFRGNPIAEHPEYEERIRRYLPRLKNLDPVKLKSVVPIEKCEPIHHHESSSEDDSFTDIQMRIPQPDYEDEEDENKPAPDDDDDDDKEESSIIEEIQTIECFKKFKENEEKMSEADCEESGTLFADIEKNDDTAEEKEEVTEEEIRKPLNFIHSTESCDHGNTGGSSETSVEGRTFCCSKHRTIFTQSANSIRLSASKQLYEQVSCDEPDSESSEFVKPGRPLALVPNSGKDSGFDDPGSDSDNALLATPKHD